MKIYIYQDEKSHKFWAVEQQGNELHISWGKVGTNGQSQVNSLRLPQPTSSLNICFATPPLKSACVNICR